MYYKKVNGEAVPMTEAECLRYELRCQEEDSYKASREFRNKKIRYERSKKYPRLGDQLDALLKQFDLMRSNGIPMAPEMEALLSSWLKVKGDYPKL